MPSIRLDGSLRRLHTIPLSRYASHLPQALKCLQRGFVWPYSMLGMVGAGNVGQQHPLPTRLHERQKIAELQPATRGPAALHPVDRALAGAEHAVERRQVVALLVGPGRRPLPCSRSRRARRWASPPGSTRPAVREQALCQLRVAQEQAADRHHRRARSPCKGPCPVHRSGRRARSPRRRPCPARQHPTGRRTRSPRKGPRPERAGQQDPPAPAVLSWPPGPRTERCIVSCGAVWPGLASASQKGRLRRAASRQVRPRSAQEVPGRAVECPSQPPHHHGQPCSGGG
mmetsp:Transcript_474/g.1558  ORF Transcript_474/g.1558 Transcript_474/m.1558 type:complete len:286 (+) Transcript_474:223-1080(+)